MLSICIRGAALLLLATAACDTAVTNPGPVQDEFLADRNAATAMVNGAGRALSSGMNWIGYTARRSRARYTRPDPRGVLASPRDGRTAS